MAKPAIPETVGRFILTSIPSVPYLEAMLLLRREPEQEWTPAALALRLYLPESQAGSLLQSLQEAGIALGGPARSRSYRYSPPAALSTMIDEVAHYYGTNLRELTNLIHSRIDRRAFDFADAFRWRKDS